MIRWSVLLFALLMSAPAVYRYVLDEIDLTEVLVRFLVAVPVAALLLAGLRFITAGYGDTEETGTEVTATEVTPTPDDVPAEPETSP
jgi:hypothetical protein